VEKFEYDDPRQSSTALPRRPHRRTFKTRLRIHRASVDVASAGEVTARGRHARPVRRHIVVGPFRKVPVVCEKAVGAGSTFPDRSRLETRLCLQCRLGTASRPLPLTRTQAACS